MYFTGNDGYQNFSAFAGMLILDSDKKVKNWISTRILSEKIKSFDTNLEQTKSNLANYRVIFRFDNSALVQKRFFHFMVTLF